MYRAAQTVSRAALFFKLTVKFSNEYRTALKVYRAAQYEYRAAHLAAKQFETLALRND